jgi:hypothetical protein
MVYPEIPDAPRAILLDTYHSGTVDAVSAAAHAFFRTAREKGIPIFVTGDNAYDSRRIFDEYGIIRLPIAPIAAYMKLWLYGTGADLTASRGGDVFH